jgi:hypothetical protein
MLFSHVFQWILYRILYHEKGRESAGRAKEPKVLGLIAPLPSAFVSASFHRLFRRQWDIRSSSPRCSSLSVPRNGAS